MLRLSTYFLPTDTMGKKASAGKDRKLKRKEVGASWAKAGGRKRKRKTSKKSERD